MSSEVIILKIKNTVHFTNNHGLQPFYPQGAVYCTDMLSHTKTMCATEIYLLSLKLLKETNEMDSEEFIQAEEFSNKVKSFVSNRQTKKNTFLAATAFR